MRLWALINKIVESDENATPIHERTVPLLVDWSIEKPRADDPEFRGLGTGDNDNQERNEDSSEDGEAVNRPHHSRHIPQSEVKGARRNGYSLIRSRQIIRTSGKSS